MKNSTTFCQESWLLVARGGWWSAGDITEQLPSGVEVDDPHNLLWVMANRYKYLERRGRGANAQYAVTPDCVTPRGLPVRRVNEALIGAQEAP